MGVVSAFSANIDTDNAIFVSEQDTLPAYSTLPASRVKSLLGSDCSLLVWDGFSGFHPDALGAASGLVRGGGLFIFIVPPLADFAKHPDRDYHRMCSGKKQLSEANTYFLERLLAFFKHDACSVFEQDSSELPECSATSSPKPSQSLPTQDQCVAIDQIIHVVEGHRKRPLVITADRGRGKSSALGIAAAMLVLKNAKTIVLTAPSKQAASQVFQHFSRHLSENTQQPSDFLQYLQFVSPDELVTTKPNCQLLMIDEAAGIPAPLLTQLLEHYARIVFSTTIHGYEGNGQGFAIRFKKQLERLTPGWKSIHLTTPVRWAEGDPFEAWISQLLFLSLNRPTFSNESDETLPLTQLSITWPRQAELSERPELLEQTIDLLVNAHYQTSPDDIRLILDHPGVHLALGFEQNDSGDRKLIAAMLLIEEGMIQEESLQEDILAGVRRLRGHLVPQSLATFSGEAGFLGYRYLRVVRIAVRAQYAGQGVGSRLLTQAYEYALREGFNFLSTAFGLTPELLKFWRKNKFSLVKLGIQKDNASACYSAMMLSPISSDTNFKELKNTFSESLIMGCNRQYRNHDPNVLLEAFSSIESERKNPALSSKQLRQVERFARASLSMEDCMGELVHLTLFCLRDKSIRANEASYLLLLIRRVLQGRSISTCVEEFKLTGKKELDKTLRKAVSLLLSQTKQTGV